ncbi:Protein of unknown function [Bacillus cereus]|nr:Protein of unknown function [Bacillus cereus]SCN33799.1 Protein of unknown function [Bacillus wiedmannii]
MLVIGVNYVMPPIVTANM